MDLIADDTPLPPSKQNCVVDGKTFTSLDEYINFGLITSDKSEPLYAYNFTTIKRQNVSRWDDLENFVEMLKDLIIRKKYLANGDGILGVLKGV